VNFFLLFTQLTEEDINLKVVYIGTHEPSFHLPFFPLHVSTDLFYDVFHNLQPVARYTKNQINPIFHISIPDSMLYYYCIYNHYNHNHTNNLQQTLLNCVPFMNEINNRQKC